MFSNVKHDMQGMSITIILKAWVSHVMQYLPEHDSILFLKNCVIVIKFFQGIKWNKK